MDLPLLGFGPSVATAIGPLLGRLWTAFRFYCSVACEQKLFRRGANNRYAVLRRLRLYLLWCQVWALYRKVCPAEGYVRVSTKTI